jgi:hypothetical protein
MAKWKSLEYPGGEIYTPLGHLSFFKCHLANELG